MERTALTSLLLSFSEAPIGVLLSPMDVSSVTVAAENDTDRLHGYLEA